MKTFFKIVFIAAMLGMVYLIMFLSVGIHQK